MVKYPTGSAVPYRASAPKDRGFWKKAGKRASFSDRGMTLEQQINESSQYYLNEAVAVVHKKPTPIQIVKVDYPKRSKAVIREAYFRQASTTDYNGVYRGYYLDFEAKETQNKTSFPLKNFHEHQIVHLHQCLQQDGICFAIIGFMTLERYFVTPATFLIKCWNDWQKNGKSSMSLEEIEANSIEIKSGFRPALPYIDAVDQIIADRNKQ